MEVAELTLRLKGENERELLNKISGDRWQAACQAFSNYLRQEIKHNVNLTDAELTVLEAIRSKFHNELIDEDLDLY